MVAPYEPNDIDKAKIEACASHGVPIRLIADYLGMSENTLRKYYGRLIQSSKVQKILDVSNALYMNAIKGNVVAQIFFLKTQAQWKDNTPEQETTEDNTIKQVEISVIRTGTYGPKD